MVLIFSHLTLCAQDTPQEFSQKEASSSPAEVTNRDDLRALDPEIARLRKALEVIESRAGGLPAPLPGPADSAAADRLKAQVEHQGIAQNIVWTLITGFLVMFMQAGFALLETGMTRAKNVGHTMAMNFMVYALGMLSYWAIGFAIQFGGTGAATSVSTVTTLGPAVAEHLHGEWGVTIAGKYFGLLGHHGFFLPPGMLEGGIFALFLFQMVFMDTTATIPTGAMAERWRFLPFCLFSLCVGGIIYPLYGNWVWGGGWLAALGKNFGLGHGHVDFAGSSVVHLCGGTLAYIGARWVGPRVGKFKADGQPEPIPGHNLPMGITGTFILAFGWFGFNAGSTLSGTDTQIGVIAVNTMLASSAGAAAGMIFTWFRFGRPDPSFMCNGMLAGLVAITAPCAFVESWAAVIIGLLAGILVVFAVDFVETKLRIDDPVGAVSVHGVCGAWGVLSLGLFANGRYGDGWNGVAGNVTGLLYGDAGQFVAEVIGVAACIVAVSLMARIAFAVTGVFGPHRAASADQVIGLDRPELGILGYQTDHENPSPHP
jgi:Amt family ammonium transporter